MIRPRKDLTLEELCQVIDQIAEHHPFAKRLWDVRQVELSLTSSEIVKGSVYAASKFKVPTKSVIVTQVEQVLAFGKMRAAMGLMPEIGTIHMVFNDYDKAISWLNEPLEGSIQPSPPPFYSI